MPEIPDIENYREALEERLTGRALRSLEVRSPFVLRTAEPPIDSLVGATVVGVGRLGKRLVLNLDRERFLVMHLMIAGRLHWIPVIQTGRRKRKAPGGKRVLFALAIDEGTLYLTEAGTKRRAAVHVLGNHAALEAMDPGGLEVQGSDAATFIARVRRENHTLKRTLTDPRILSGIGNAYSDEILHRARLSPMLQSAKVDDATLLTLHAAIGQVLERWTVRLREQRFAEGDGFPVEVTAFHADMAVHGRFGAPCPDCSAPIQRIVYANKETNYCAACQTDGRILKDRALSRLLKDSFPARLED